jgi:hypothetical protein
MESLRSDGRPGSTSSAESLMSADPLPMVYCLAIILGISSGLWYAAVWLGRELARSLL